MYLVEGEYVDVCSLICQLKEQERGFRVGGKVWIQVNLVLFFISYDIFWVYFFIVKQDKDIFFIELVQDRK